MSMSVFLVPLAIAICATASEKIGDIIDKCNSGEKVEPIQTKINDFDLLLMTLQEHGLNPIVYNNNCVDVASASGRLKYFRESVDQSFSIELDRVNNIDCLISDLTELENEYDRNVQSFTYNRIINNLPQDMTIIEDEVLEDESILLTISVAE